MTPSGRSRRGPIQQEGRLLSLSYCLILFAFLFVPATTRAGGGASPTVSIGGGVHTMFNRATRQAFGSEGRFTLGVTAPLAPGTFRLAAEVGTLSARGTDHEPDPTFEMAEATCHWVPVSVEIQRDLIHHRSHGARALWIGAGLAFARVRYTDPFGEERAVTTPGFVAEVRPELRFRDHVDLWVRAQVLLVSGVAFSNAGVSDLSPSGSGIEGGIAYRFANRK
ncbi:MAG: hypothetical protein IT349_20920 [Candidatus Eisenbacteria bacterium]|nr:hypothetical protein [Candidatus Eisenbacteria bacterium]